MVVIILYFLDRIFKIGLFYFDCLKLSGQYFSKTLSWLSFPEIYILLFLGFFCFPLKFQNVIFFKFPCERWWTFYN